MNSLIAYLKTLVKKPMFIAFRGFFTGALAAQLDSAYNAGHIDLSWKALSQMLVGATVAAVIALWHLYTPKPIKANSVNNAESERSNEDKNNTSSVSNV